MNVPHGRPVPSHTFRDALAHFASGVTVVTAWTADGRVGFTATGFASVSLSPPLVLVCVGHRASAHDGVVGAARFGVSVLSERQRWIAEQFARSGVDRFRDVPIQNGGVPLVEGALVALECRRQATHEAGDHTVLIGEVVGAAIQPGRPLVHYARRYGAFVAEPSQADPPRNAIQTGDSR
jgi:flavin reductase (DIM6/NTAB) family NADH-FMN oxidoreductase RutF